MKRYAKLLNDRDVDDLQEAAADVAYLTGQGLSPTEAIAKVASAAQFPVNKTRLLTYAFTNGVAAEKRGSTGGPFERLAEYPLPDPKEIHRLVYGALTKEAESIPASLGPDGSHIESQKKTASVGGTGFLPRGMATFDTDVTGMDLQEIRELFGLAKIAECDDKDLKPQSFSISRTTITLGLGEEDPEKRCSPELPKTLQEKLSEHVKRMSPEMSHEIETTLMQLLGAKKSAMIAANSEADDAFRYVQQSLNLLGSKLNHRHLNGSFKRAGLASVNAYYPDVAKLLTPFIDDVNGRIVKEAAYASTDVTIRHPWVAEAEALDTELRQVADLTIEANRKTAEYKAVQYLYAERGKIKKSAGWTSFLAGGLLGPSQQTAKDLILGGDQSQQKAEVQKDVLGDLDDPLHDLNLRDITMSGMFNDFAVNDEILRAYKENQLMRGYNALLHTAPSTMRDSTQARALLQQYMTQGRMAPTELMPALQMNKLVPRKETIERKGSDE